MMPIFHRRRTGLIDGLFPRLPSSIRERRINLMGIVYLFGLFGFFLITASLYSSLQRQQQRKHALCIDLEVEGSLNITIFAAPRPFSADGFKDMVDLRQELAVRSWLAVSPDVTVVLFGQHPSIRTFAARIGPRVVVESDIDFTFLGTPFFHAMVARSRASHSGISILIDPEAILLPDIVTTLLSANKLSHDWFLVSMIRNILHFPFNLDDTGMHWLQEDGVKVNVKKLLEFMTQKKNLGSCSSRLIVAWNIGDLPLHAGVLPPFLYGKSLHNEWLVNEVLSSDFRFVFDATEVISSFYPEYLGKWSTKLYANTINKDERNWESRGNHLLASTYGSLYFQSNNISRNPLKLLKHFGKYFFINPSDSTMYLLQQYDKDATYSLKPVLDQDKGRKGLPTSLLQSQRAKKWITHKKEILPLDIEGQCSFRKLCRVAFKTLAPLSLPFSLESLLHKVADRNRSIVLAVAGNNYRDMLMNWVCRLRFLAIRNYLVCALDDEVYQFSVLQGLPVFKDPMAPRDISFNDCHFGTKCFQRVTKVKSRIVLQILKLGYSVLLSDVDVYWFVNPLPIVRSFGPAALVVQSDEYSETGPINLPRRLNSGFYFAQSDPCTIASMELVVKHASTSSLSEQPSFYDVLCGEGGVNRVSDDRCIEPNTNLTVHFLDRNLFPNGAYKSLWEKRNVRSACKKQGCIILHNNWINGRKKKVERQLHSGLLDYDSSLAMCLHNWHKNNSMSFF